MSNKNITKTVNAIGTIIIRSMAIILAIGSIVVLYRGYIKTSNGIETGGIVYFMAFLSLFYAGVLWRWSQRK